MVLPNQFPLIPFPFLAIMSNCKYCHKPISEEDETVDGGIIHLKCDEERLRRVAAGKCVACGDAVKLSAGYRRMDCNENNRVFRGYPGP